MSELQGSLSALGFSNVVTYLQSGNIIFCTKKSDKSSLAVSIKDRIMQDFGHDVSVLVMSAVELEVIAGSNPLWPKTGGVENLYHCTFLFNLVSPPDFHALKLPVAVGEHAVLVGNTVLLHCPYGYGKTKLNNNFFEKALGVTATTRNWRTVLALHELCISH